MTSHRRPMTWIAMQDDQQRLVKSTDPSGRAGQPQASRPQRSVKCTYHWLVEPRNDNINNNSQTYNTINWYYCALRTVFADHNAQSFKNIAQQQQQQPPGTSDQLAHGSEHVTRNGSLTSQRSFLSLTLTIISLVTSHPGYINTSQRQRFQQ